MTWQVSLVLDPLASDDVDWRVLGTLTLPDPECKEDVLDDLIPRLQAMIVMLLRPEEWESE